MKNFDVFYEEENLFQSDAHRIDLFAHILKDNVAENILKLENGCSKICFIK